MKRIERKSYLIYIMFFVIAAFTFVGCSGSGSTTKASSVVWNEETSSDSGKIALTPGATSRSLNFAWYAKKKGTPAVQISTSSKMASAKTYKGKSTSISRKNWKYTYKASNKVSIVNKFSKNKTYYYRYTDNVSGTKVTWSSVYRYKTRDPYNFQVAVLGDIQIGASGSKGEGTANDSAIKKDVIAYQKMLNIITKKVPKVSFFMSVGDQTNCYKKSDTKGIRESEYAGFLYPSILRSIPMATTIGNHDAKGSAYQYHFNNPNSSKKLGKTKAGCDYYYRYGNTLFIVLNSNSTSKSQHTKLVKEAVSKNKGAKWRVVMFHHDIYGSGAQHSNTDSKKVRKWLAPIMDRYKIDVCLTGHDHCYARSYQMKGGKIYKYSKKTTVKKPKGTVYFTAGTSTGSKYYKLAKKRQSYIAERRNKAIATYSVLSITNSKLTVRTYDINGKKYANTYTIKK